VCRLKLAADAGADVCFIGHQNERIARINCQRPRTETRAYYICHGRCGADLGYLSIYSFRFSSTSFREALHLHSRPRKRNRCVPKSSVCGTVILKIFSLSTLILCSSLLTHFLCCRSARYPCCHAIIEKDWHQLRIRAVDGRWIDSHRQRGLEQETRRRRRNLL